MCLLPAHHQIMTCQRRLACFQGPNEQSSANLTDTRPIACGLYNQKSRSFCTASGMDIMVWDAASGHLMRRFADVTPTPITSMCFDDRLRKLLVADHAGHIVVINYQNGALMKAMQRHSSEVSALLYVPNHRHVLSASWDRKLLVQDESPPDEGHLIKAMHAGNPRQPSQNPFRAPSHGRRVSLLYGSHMDMFCCSRLIAQATAAT